jgi:hypothetical protein
MLHEMHRRIAPSAVASIRYPAEPASAALLSLAQEEQQVSVAPQLQERREQPPSVAQQRQERQVPQVCLGLPVSQQQVQLAQQDSQARQAWKE